ncbi:cytochrome P450 [Xylariaceae sp. FL1019]|nr:cytochrome P450 [Xylariaceae sp. FL1019]
MYIVARCLHIFYFHPLAKYPGPRKAALTDAWYAFAWARGKYPLIMYATHRKYGDVVRIGPNKLSFATVQAHHDVYGNKPLFRKSDWYSGGRAGGIIFERNPVVHNHTRKALIAGFSTRYLRDKLEEPVKELLDMVPRLLGQGEKESTEVCRLFTMISFDTIGLVTLGKTFLCVETDTVHPLADLMHTGAFAATLVPLRRRLWLFNQVMNYRFKGKDPDMLRAQHVGILKAEIDDLIARGSIDQGDGIISKVLREKSLENKYILSNAINLLIAGSETIATGLSTAVFMLLQNKTCLETLQSEIRGAFENENDITGDSTAKLPYLKAVIDETLRLIPPSPFGQSRTSPGASVDGHYIPAGVDVSIDVWCLHHSPLYWAEPEKFAPERWLSEKDGFVDSELANLDFGDNKEAFQPFSEGPRSCFGMGLAYFEMRMILARLIWRYDWKLDSRSRDWLAGLRLEFMWRKAELFVHFIPRSDAARSNEE